MIRHLEPISEGEARVIDISRRLCRRATSVCVEAGALPIDAAIGSLYAAHDAATVAVGGPEASIEWMRLALDVLEQSLFDRRDVS